MRPGSVDTAVLHCFVVSQYWISYVWYEYVATTGRIGVGNHLFCLEIGKCWHLKMDENLLIAVDTRAPSRGLVWNSPKGKVGKDMLPK